MKGSGNNNNNNPGVTPHYMKINFSKPTVAEFLSSVTRDKVQQPLPTQEFATIVWNAYACMSDEERNYMLKGILERSSSAQKNFMRTQLAKGVQYSNDVVLVRYINNRF